MPQEEKKKKITVHSGVCVRTCVHVCVAYTRKVLAVFLQSSVQKQITKTLS